jgi:hypothetical protein
LRVADTRKTPGNGISSHSDIRHDSCQLLRLDSQVEGIYNTASLMVKIHLFSGFENTHLKIRRDTPLGHLYSDQDRSELMEAARLVGVNPKCLQNSRGFFHFDLWGKPLFKARLFYPRVNNRELYRDLQAVPERSRGSNKF